MNQSNPLLPQGSEPPKPRVQSSIRIAVVTILTIHAALFAGLLMQGCKPETENKAEVEPPVFDPNVYATADQPPFASTNTTEAVPPAIPILPEIPAPVPTPGNEVAMNNTTATTPPPVPVPDASLNETKTHVVAKGEFIETIAKKYGVTSAAVLAANPKVNPNRMQVGTKLTIPSSVAGTMAAPSLPGEPQVYEVRSGDNLTKIAKQFSVSVNELRSANGLKTDRLNVGQKLKIPAKMASAPDSVPTAQGGPPPLPVPPPPQ